MYIPAYRTVSVSQRTYSVCIMQSGEFIFTLLKRIKCLIEMMVIIMYAWRVSMRKDDFLDGVLRCFICILLRRVCLTVKIVFSIQSKWMTMLQSSLPTWISHFWAQYNVKWHDNYLPYTLMNMYIALTANYISDSLSYRQKYSIALRSFFNNRRHFESLSGSSTRS